MLSLTQSTVTACYHQHRAQLPRAITNTERSYRVLEMFEGRETSKVHVSADALDESLDYILAPHLPLCPEHLRQQAVVQVQVREEARTLKL